MGAYWTPVWTPVWTGAVHRYAENRKERPLKTAILMTVFLLSSFYVFSCIHEGNDDICADYCQDAEICYEINNIGFSVTKCTRECRDEKEAKKLIGCDRQFTDLKECENRLSCAAMAEVGDKCASEINSLTKCID
jgi:hypothetical protein